MSRDAIIKGILIMTFFLSFSIVANILTDNIDPLSFSTYQKVDIENLTRNPSKYEGKDISSTSTIAALQFNETVSLYTIVLEEGVTLLYQDQDTDNLQSGMRISFRGKSFIVSRNIIEVQEIHVWHLLPYLLTVPGVIVFISSFFFIYKVDWKNLALIPRRKENA